MTRNQYLRHRYSSFNNQGSTPTLLYTTTTFLFGGGC